jgi:hypothetical protein
VKKVLWIGGGAVAVIVAVIVVLAIYVYSSFEDIVEEAIERFGSAATKTEVVVDDVSVSPTGGKGSVSGISIGNPAGYSANNAFELGAISVLVDTESVTGDVVVINEIGVATPVINYEFGDGGSNLDVIKSNVDAYAKSFGGSEASAEEGGKTRMIIENLIIRDGEASVSGGLLGDESVGTAIPNIHLKDIGKEKGGASTAELTERIITALTAGVTGAVGKLDIKGLAGGVVEGASGAVEGATGAVDDATKGATEGAEGVGGAVKKLFGD